VLGEHELEAALQLLVERAQFITGATGAALALLHGEEMVCHASAGSSAPAVGVRLQVLSGLTGESISRKQLLRCDNAETDGRVNLETCQELGIASIVVLPLLARNGEVRGLFELFSDHAYAFEERDLRALERMAELTGTALDLAETHQLPIHIPPPVHAPSPAAETPQVAPPVEEETTVPAAIPAPQPSPEAAEVQPETLPPPLPSGELPAASASAIPPADESEATPPALAVPDAMLRVQKCASCGFPISEGRSLCLDCESKRGRPSEPGDSVPEEFVPNFLASVVPKEESWLANHVNLLAVVVLILSILVAVVVFR
jgi:putative methionine-R-sulfoxide reductase with GAF domain